LIEEADFDRPPTEEEISVAQIAEAIARRYQFAKDGGGRLYIFRDGTYRADGASAVRQDRSRPLHGSNARQ
jgi:hypothetical protein